MNNGLRCVVIGASGAIGAEFVAWYCRQPNTAVVYAVSRSAKTFDHPLVRSSAIDLLDEASILSAIQQIGADGPIDRLVIASGVLHNASLQPEKALRDLDMARMADLFAINTFGPALVLKHAIPFLPRDRTAVIAALSARVGSISDNRLGGWYAYRASKAALNQILRTAAIEAQRRWPQAVIVGLHPGTVDSQLSKPFQGAVKPGHLFTAQESVDQMASVLEQLSPEQSGRVYAYDGQEIAP